MDPEDLYDIPYVSDGHERQKLDLFLPNGKGPHPLIVYIHGGAFMFGTKKTELLPKYLRDKGYAIASLDYRLSGDAIFPAALQDCKSAVRWLRVHAERYGLDRDKFIAWGESAGGHQVAMLGTTGTTRDFDVGEYLTVSSEVQGVVDYYAPTDFLRMDDDPLPDSMKHSTPTSPESKYLGGFITDIPEKVEKANPISYVSDSTPPFFIAHGTKDHIVSINQSEILVEALKAAGRDVTFHPVDGADHVFRGITDEQSKSLSEATEQFLKRIVS